MKVIYKGFSTHTYNVPGGSFSLTNIDLVNLDILSHIYTEKEERVMMCDFGTNIPLLAGEPLTELLMEDIHDELERVFDYDPRVEKLQLTITPYYDANSVVVTAVLRYIELNVVQDLNFTLNLDTGEG